MKASVRYWLFVAALGVGAGFSANAVADTRTEDFADDPGWTGIQNVGVYGNDYGFKNSNNAGAVAGEMGGTIASRTPEFTWYADTNLGGSLTPLNDLSVTGRFIAQSNTHDPMYDGSVALGFFDAVNPQLNVENGHVQQGMYMRILEGAGGATEEYRVGVLFGENRSDPFVIAAATPYLFTLTYNSTGGGPAIGRLTAEVRLASNNTLVGTASVDNDNIKSFDLNAFGLQTDDHDEIRGSADIFYDDLAYTVPAIPEPGMIGLAGALGLGLLRRRR